MSLNHDLFVRAFTLTKKEYSILEKGVAHSFISKLEELLTNNRQLPPNARHSYPELLRRTLNDFRFQKKTREAYRSLAGRYGGFKSALVRKQRKPHTPPKPQVVRERSSVAIVMNGNQSGWDF